MAPIQRMTRSVGAALLCLTFAAVVRGEVEKDVPYVPTPQPVVDKMLELAQPKEGEKIYDLGCGDGRIVVTAAKKYGVTGVGVDIDPERINEANENAEKAGVTDKVKFIEKNLFDMDFADADILGMYLLPAVNAKLRPKILAEMKPGSRVVSHAFDMGDWKPDKTVRVKESGGRVVYFWVVPARVNGSSQATVKTSDGEQKATLNLTQKYQYVDGTAKIGDKEVQIKEGKLTGNQLTFEDGGQEYTAIVESKDKSATASARTK